MVMSTHKYDLAVSFAGEERNYVEQTVRACQALGMSVFYDKDKTNEWWGGNFIRAQRTIYSSQTRFFVPFLSANYLAKPIPMDEFSAAMMTAVKQGNGYILPVLVDDTRIPAELLHPHIQYLRASQYTPEELARQLQQKVQTAKAEGQRPADIGPVVEKALQVRLAKIVPSNWSRYETLDRVFDYLARRFKEGGEQLRPQGLLASVRVGNDTISVRVERGGETVAGLDLEKGRQMRDDQITWSVGRHRSMSSGFNGWAAPKFDTERGRPVIEISDFASLGRRSRIDDLSAASEEEFFTLLWDMLIDQIER